MWPQTAWHAAPGLLLLLLFVAWPHGSRAVAAAAASVPVTVTASSVQLSPAVMLIGKFDWQADPGSPKDVPWSRCLDMVWRAKTAGSDRVNFVPTHHWLPPADQAQGSNSIGGFCFMHHQGVGDFSSGNICSPWSQEVINEYRAAMTLCFAEALRQGLTVYVRPHLDDGTANGAWRNGLLLQPEQKHNGFSYVDIMLNPLADALREALATTAAEDTLRALPGRSRPVAYFAMQGEMSATIMRFASQWGDILDRIRGRLASPHADIKLGIGLNFNRLDDTTSVSKSYDSSRLSWLMWQMGAENGDVPPVDVTGLKQLLSEQLDFVGMSAYAPYTGPGMALKEFENAAFMFAGEMRDSYGIDVAGLVRSGRLELQYSEFGLGGGGSYGGKQVADTPGQVALRPFFGIYGPYSLSTDPWSISENRAFLREFYSKALTWLSDPSKTTFRISCVFIWSMASWDVLGVYPESTTPGGSYRDEATAAAITTYNQAVVAAQRVAAASNSYSGGGAVGSSELSAAEEVPPAAGRRHL